MKGNEKIVIRTVATDVLVLSLPVLSFHSPGSLKLISYGLILVQGRKDKIHKIYEKVGAAKAQAISSVHSFT